MRNEDLHHAFNTVQSAMQTVERAMEFFKDVTITPKTYTRSTDNIVNTDRKIALAKAFLEEYEMLCKRYGLMIDSDHYQFVTSNGSAEARESDGTILSDHITSLRTSINLNNIILTFKP